MSSALEEASKRAIHVKIFLAIKHERRYAVTMLANLDENRCQKFSPVENVKRSENVLTILATMRSKQSEIHLIFGGRWSLARK